MTDPESGEEPSSRLQNALAIEELVAANEASNRTMVDLVRNVQAETEARDRKVDALAKSQHMQRILSGLGVVCISLVLVLAIINAFELASTRRAAHKQAMIAEQVQKTNDTLLDCLNTTGQCGQINSANQAKILDEVKKYELTGFYCIRNNPAIKDPNGEKFLKCVNELYPGGPQLNGR